MKLRILTTTLMLSGTISGCVTAGPSSKNNTIKKVRGATLHQTNRKQPVITQLDRSSWVQIRKQTSSDDLRLYATLGTRDWQVAVNEARRVLQKKPHDFVAMHVLSTALAMQQNYNLAAFYAELLEKKYPSRSEAKNLMALAILHQAKPRIEDYSKAIDLLADTFSTQKYSVAAGLNLGYLHLQTGNAREAQKVFIETENRCRCEPAIMGRGIAQSRLRDYKNAALTFKRILKKSPENPMALYRLALIERNGFNNNSKAMEYLKTVVAHEGKHPELHRKANVLLRKIQASEYNSNVKGAEYVPVKEIIE